MNTTTKINRHKIALPIDRIADLCREFDVRELAVFGSFLGDDFEESSDVDFLVDFRTDDLGPWFGKLVDMRAKLESLVGRRVDLVSRRSVESGPNYLIRRQILSTAEPIYVEG